MPRLAKSTSVATFIVFSASVSNAVPSLSITVFRRGLLSKKKKKKLFLFRFN